MSTDFEEVRLESDLIIEATVGGPAFSTDVIIVRSGSREAEHQLVRRARAVGDRRAAD